LHQLAAAAEQLGHDEQRQSEKQLGREVNLTPLCDVVTELRAEWQRFVYFSETFLTTPVT